MTKAMEKRITGYTIVQTENRSQLYLDIVETAGEGWFLYGELSVTPLLRGPQKGDVFMYSQAMVKYERGEE